MSRDPTLLAITAFCPWSREGRLHRAAEADMMIVTGVEHHGAPWSTMEHLLSALITESHLTLPSHPVLAKALALDYYWDLGLEETIQLVCSFLILSSGK